MNQKMKKYEFSGAFPVVKSFNYEFCTVQDVYIKEVIYQEPATIVFWSDGTKTVCKCSGNDIYSPEAGFAICVLKKLAGSTNIKTLFSDWVPTPDSVVYDDEGYVSDRITLSEVRRKQKKN